ncbi:hypothetical protein ACLB2K_036489 [Fragaria x ananassa]
MDTASATTMKALNFLATSTTQRSINFTSQTLPTKSNAHYLHLQSSNTRRSRAIYLSRCSTKPDTDTDNQKDQNSTVEPNLNPKPLNPSPPTSVDPLSTPISSFPSSSTKGLVFDLGVENSWDGAEIGSPVVKRFLGDEEERWYMWYHGRSDSNPGSDSIGLAVSSNGVHWNRGRGAVQSSQDVGLVMSSGKDWAQTLPEQRPSSAARFNGHVACRNRVDAVSRNGQRVATVSKKFDFSDTPCGVSDAVSVRIGVSGSVRRSDTPWLEVSVHHSFKH